MADPELAVKGNNGQVELYDNKVVIKRKGILARLDHSGAGEKEILFEDINGIQFKNAGIRRGYIQFEQSGYSVDSPGDDENTVMFSKRHQDSFDELRDAVQGRRKEVSESGTATGGQSAMETLRERYAAGEISKEEFEERRDVLEG